MKDQFRISDDERLITLTKKAYDDLNNKVEKLERESDNTIKIYTSMDRHYHHNERDWWRSIEVDAYFPNRIKSYVEDFKKECDDLVLLINKRLEEGRNESIAMDKKVDEFESRQKLQKLLPKWILRLYGIKDF